MPRSENGDAFLIHDTCITAASGRRTEVLIVLDVPIGIDSKCLPCHRIQYVASDDVDFAVSYSDYHT